MAMLARTPRAQEAYRLGRSGLEHFMRQRSMRPGRILLEVTASCGSSRVAIAERALGFEQAPGSFACEGTARRFAQIALEPLRGLSPVANLVVRDSTQVEGRHACLRGSGKARANESKRLLRTRTRPCKTGRVAK